MQNYSVLMSVYHKEGQLQAAQLLCDPHLYHRSGKACPEVIPTASTRKKLESKARTVGLLRGEAPARVFASLTGHRLEACPPNSPLFIYRSRDWNIFFSPALDTGPLWEYSNSDNLLPQCGKIRGKRDFAR